MPVLALTHAIAIAISVGLDQIGHPDGLRLMWGYLGAVAFLHILPSIKWLNDPPAPPSAATGTKPVRGRQAAGRVDARERDGPSFRGVGIDQTPSQLAHFGRAMVALALTVGLISLLHIGREGITLIPVSACLLGFFSCALAQHIEFGPVFDDEY